MASTLSPMSTPLFALLSICLFILCTLTSSIKTSQIFSASQESDRVITLPGQPSDPLISQFSGYITVNQDHGRALFYWFFEAQSHPSEKPLVLWLNGGPGCSSIGFGAALELGPLRVNINGSGLLFNKFGWNQDANLLFVESPVGVGFSYTNTSSDLSNLDDVFSAEDAYNFVVNWLERFSQYKNHDFFIAGESYAGHYVPQLAELVHDRNNDTTKYPFIHLKGFIVGNPETNDYYDYTGILEYAWSHAVISDQIYDKAKRACHFEQPIWSEECDNAMSVLDQSYDEIDIRNIYAPRCFINGSLSFAERSQYILPSLIKRNGVMRIPGGYDPCYTPHATHYFNRADVQSALHAIRGNGTVNWEACNQFIFQGYSYYVTSVLPIYTKLIKGGLRIWVYSHNLNTIHFAGISPLHQKFPLPLPYSNLVVSTVIPGLSPDALRPIIPDNACILYIIAAVGTELIDAYSPDTIIASSPRKEIHYPGDVDGRVPVIGTRYCVEALALTLKSPWRTWYYDHQVAGRMVKYEGLTFITVRGAGHMVPLNKPKEALFLFRSFLAGEELPKNR